MAKLRIFGTAGRDRIDLTGKEKSLGTQADGFEVFAGDEADHVTGSALHDILRGEAGDDILEGGKGNDILLGGAGRDTLDGGEGSDTASYEGQAGFVDANLATGIGTVITLSFGPGLLPGLQNQTEDDKFRSIENLTAGDDGSRLIGNAAANILTGGRGRDLLIGGGGNDTLIGGEGIDTVSYAGQTMFVDVNLATGTAKIVSSANLVVEQDTLSDIENVIAGYAGSRIVGNASDNVFTSGAHNDSFDGGAGSDTVSYAGRDGFVEVNLGAGTGTVSADSHVLFDHDTLSNIENVVAGNGGSYIFGDANANVLTGGAGSDTLYGDGTAAQGNSDTLIGNGGADLLQGGFHNDVLTGGAGADLFGYGNGFFLRYYLGAMGIDRITDFDVSGADHDVIELINPVLLGADFSGTVADAIAQGYIYWAASQSGAGTTVFVDRDGGGNDGVAVFQLDGVTPDQLGALHFAF